MRGSIRRRSPGSWTLVYDLPADPATGRRRQKSTTVHGTKRDAQRRLTELLQQSQTGAYTEPTTQTVGEYLDYWLTHAAEPRVSAGTLNLYRRTIEAHLRPRLGEIRLTALRPVHIAECYTTLSRSGNRRTGAPLAPQSIIRVHRLLHAALEQAVRWELIPSSPCARVSPPAPSREAAPVLTASQTAQLLESLQETDYHLPVLIAVLTGLRRGEILGLQWRDVDLPGQTLTIHRALAGGTRGAIQITAPKTSGSRRTLAIPASLCEVLAVHQETQRDRYALLELPHTPETHLCTNGLGEPLLPNTLSMMVTRHLQALGITGTLHSLRHTHATLLLEAGIHIRVVSARLGHTNVKITLDRYSHLVAGMDAGAAAAAAALLAPHLRPNPSAVHAHEMPTDPTHAHQMLTPQKPRYATPPDPSRPLKTPGRGNLPCPHRRYGPL